MYIYIYICTYIYIYIYIYISEAILLAKLLHSADGCNILQHTATRCNTLQHTGIVLRPISEVISPADVLNFTDSSNTLSPQYIYIHNIYIYT